ncbi:MAG: APC family permease [Acidimicrobiales bacterium]
MTVAAKPQPLTGGGRDLRRQIGPVGLLFAGVGSIIGSGWLFGAFNAAQDAGPLSMFAWLLGAGMILLIGMVYSEIGAMYPVGGGVVRFPHWSFGPFASFTLGWVTWLAAAVVAPIEVEGAMRYASHYVNGLVHSQGGQHVLTFPVGYVVAVAAMALFVVVNFIGIGWFARINNVLVWWKLAIITLVIVAFLLTSFHTANFTSHGFAPTGAKGFFHTVVVAGIVFSFLGFRQGVELGGESTNPERNIPLAVIGSVLLTAVIYVLLQVAFIGSLAPSDLAHGWQHLSFTNDAGPLAAIASAIGLGWLATLLYADAVVSPGDTGLIYTTVTARLSYAMARNENAPEALSRTNARGVPIASVVLAWVVGIIIFLPFPSWNKLVGFVTSATVLSFGSGSLVLMSMRNQFPDKRRPFRLPGGHVIPFLAFYAANLMVYWAGWDVVWKLMASVGIGLVVLALQFVFRRDAMPPMLWRNGWWVLGWFVLLTVASWQGIYSSDGTAQGQQSNLPFGWDFVAILTISVVVYLVALRYQLTPAQAKEHMVATEGADFAEQR